MTDEERRKQQENTTRQMYDDIKMGFLIKVGIPALLVIVVWLIVIGVGTCTGSLKDGSNAH